MTFLKAKKTLLQPLRTEVFKEQVKLFTEILKLFRGKGEVDLRKEAGFSLFEEANVVSMYDDYARHFFDVDIPEDKRPYSRTLCPMSIMPKELLMLADDYSIPDRPHSAPPPADPRTRAASWNTYKYQEVRVPKVMIDHESHITEFIESPFIPKALAVLLKEYIDLLQKNRMRIEDLLTKAAAEMPSKYPNIEALQKASFHWLNSAFVDDFEHLKPQAEKISDFIRGHLGTEDLLK